MRVRLLFFDVGFSCFCEFSYPDLRRTHSSRCYAKREKNIIGRLFGYGVFFYVWEGVIDEFEGVSFGIENSGYLFFFIFLFLSV